MYQDVSTVKFNNWSEVLGLLILDFISDPDTKCILHIFHISFQNRMGILPSCNCTIVWLHHLDFNKVLGEKKLYGNYARMLHVVWTNPQSSTPQESSCMATYLPSKTRWVLLAKPEQTPKWSSPVDSPHIWIHQYWPTSKN